MTRGLFSPINKCKMKNFVIVYAMHSLILYLKELKFKKKTLIFKCSSQWSEEKWYEIKNT